MNQVKTRKVGSDSKLKPEPIMISEELLNKYEDVKNIFLHEKSKIKLNIFISEFLEEILDVNFNLLDIETTKKLANKIFVSYHSDNVFINNKNRILVSKRGIYESVEKIYNNYSQRKLIKEHLIVFSSLGKIIESAKLVNQVYERKGRVKYNRWHYYLDGVVIGKKEFLIEFEVVSVNNGNNLYRIQRLEKM